MNVRTVYEGPTDTRGSRIVVLWSWEGRRHRRAVPYDYAATDPHAAAVTLVTGDPAPTLVDGYGDGYRYATRSPVTLTLRADEVTRQSLRALRRHIDTRGSEELRDALTLLAAELGSGRDVTLTAGAPTS